MDIQLEKEWKTALSDEFSKPYFLQLIHFVKQEYQNKTCFPDEKDIFAAFNSCPLEQLKVVIIGQDPYHDKRQANGLCFSVQDGMKLPPSLQNIFKELGKDTGKEYPKSGNLYAWAKQGVLLLNATLTVAAHQAGSHQKKGWETFTDSVIQYISEHRENIVFLLWGGFAKNKGKHIDTDKHLVLTSGHPSPLSANRGYWFGNEHFSKTNIYLLKKGFCEIVW